jgi:uncharacterized protein YbjT (DUF2867 family)
MLCLHYECCLSGGRERWCLTCALYSMPTETRNRDRLILVTGATGRQGGASLRHLRERGFPVRALTRNPDQPKAHLLVGHGTEVVRGDFEDEISLTRALDGVYGVHSVQTWRDSGIEGEIRQGTHLADAAKVRISHFVYSSVAAADQRTGIPHFESKFRMEEHIRSSGMRYTIVRPAFFMEDWLYWLGMRQRIEGGTLSLPLTPETRLQMVAVDDIGGLIAMAFERPAKWQDRAFELAGDELSMAELAKVFSRVTGHEVRYVQVPWHEFEAQAGRETEQMFRWFQDVGFHVDIPAVRQEYPKLTTFDHWLNTTWHTAKRTAG